MGSFTSNNPNNQNPNNPAFLGNGPDKPIFSDETDMSKMTVSRSPLDLGSSGAAKASPAEPVKPAAKEPAQQTDSSDRVTGVRTFFTKLHPGALEFLDEQISKWLKENPDIVVKHTNLTTGVIQAKKTEPNIIMTVWY